MPADQPPSPTPLVDTVRVQLPFLLQANPPHLLMETFLILQCGRRGLPWRSGGRARRCGSCGQPSAVIPSGSRCCTSWAYPSLRSGCVRVGLVASCANMPLHIVVFPVFDDSRTNGVQKSWRGTGLEGWGRPPLKAQVLTGLLYQLSFEMALC